MFSFSPAATIVPLNASHAAEKIMQESRGPPLSPPATLPPHWYALLGVTSTKRGVIIRRSKNWSGLSTRWLAANIVVPSLERSKASPPSSVPLMAATGKVPVRKSHKRTCLSRPPDTNTSAQLGSEHKLRTLEVCPIILPKPLQFAPTTCLSVTATDMPDATSYTLTARSLPPTSNLLPSWLKANAFNSDFPASFNRFRGSRALGNSQSASVPAASTAAKTD
mmetsp:Transcript_133846/g.334140  ORF Transcript_133846/g.334140 Transcript_133846/m.334140 type:complete len:222 (+) Transcript_133846:269-934(+)